MNTQEITLLIQSLGTVGIVLLLFFQNRILRTQINKQTEIINNIEAFHRMFDIKKVHEFVDLREKTYEEKYERIQQEFEKRLKEEMDKTNSVTEKYELLNVYFTELTERFTKMFEGYSEDEMRAFAKTHQSGLGVFHLFLRYQYGDWMNYYKDKEALRNEIQLRKNLNKPKP